RRKMLRIALDWDNVNRLRLMRMHIDREAEIGWEVAAYLAPGFAGIVGAHYIPVLLHEQHIRARGVQRDAVDTVPDFSGRIWHEIGLEPAIDRLPGLAAIVGSKRPSRGNRNENTIVIFRIDDNRV